MADGIILMPGSGNEVYPLKVVDNGDGTWSLGTTTVGTGGGGAATIADGADVAEGAVADAAVAAGAAGTLSAKLRRLTTDLGTLLGIVPAARGANGSLKVEGWSAVITVTPTLTAATIYHVGDAVGGKQTITAAVPASSGSAVLQAITVRDKSNQKAPLSIVLFNADPTAATITNHAAFVYSTDISKEITVIDVAANDYVTVNSIATARLRNLAIPVTAVGSANLFAIPVTLVSPGTYAAVSDLDFIYRFI